MKKKFFFIIVATFAILFSLKCKKESTITGPVLSFVIDTGYVWIDTAMATGDTAIIGLQCTWNGYDRITTINTYLNDEKLGDSYLVDNPQAQSLTFETKITRSLSTREKWEFEVIDSKGHISKAALTLTIDSGGPIKTVMAIIGAQEYTYGSYFDLTNEIIYTADSAANHQEFIDLLGGYHFGEKTFFTSPGSQDFLEIYDLAGWAPGNLTLFCSTTISDEQFELIDKDNVLISSFHEDKAVEIIKGIKVNQVYSFKTSLGKFGLIIIRKEAASESGWINFDYKIQL